jgi:drug/metabolite transporter (DMT)-like permease
MGFFFLALSAIFSLSVAQVLKFVEIKSLRVLNVLVINYLVAVLISIFSTDWSGFSDQKGLLPILIHSAILGFLFIANFLIYSKSIDKNGMGISIAAMRMSLVFPILLSLFIYDENASVGLIVGIFLTFISLILLVPSIKKDRNVQLKFAVLPILLFFISGITDSGLKIFEREFSLIFDESQFLASLFLFAFLTGAVILFIRRQLTFNLKEILYGTVLGVVNLYSSYFILMALKEIPGSIVFPVANLSIVFVGTFIGVIFWKDRPDNKQWIGLFLASISIFLLVV